MIDSSFQFEMPPHHKSIIKVIGVGGGGSNAVNHMYSLGIKDVDFAVSNTDKQALKISPVPVKLQLGNNELGAGGKPDKGREAAMESREEIRDYLSDNTKMLFITAGMGGGTGTGAAPIIAKIARELDILTVGIVTAPFGFEGKRKKMSAEEGISVLKEHCDTVLVILNDKLRELFNNLTITQAFAEADNVLATAAKSIAEIITETRYVNVDFEDVKTVLTSSGAAVMGSAVAEGEGRALKAAEEALSSPLLDNTDIRGARKILLSITFGDKEELRMDELAEITDYIEEKAGDDADVIWGQGCEPALGGGIRVTVIATGFDGTPEQVNARRIYDLDSEKEVSQEKPQLSRPQAMPTFHRPDASFNKSNEHRREDAAQERPSKPVPPQQSLFEEGKADTHADNQFVSNNVNNSSVPANDQQNEAENEELKRKLYLQAKQRRETLKNMNTMNLLDKDEYRNRLEVPAYQRKNVELKDIPHSSERQVSRFTLNDDNEILGNNKFLHDNAD
ncbi:cell division protein FtsZ [Cytophagaceae bacterium ABcell3]|nr:cell division protein FtsZ [Cytophagaceae bacterium ABcell3]